MAHAASPAGFSRPALRPGITALGLAALLLAPVSGLPGAAGGGPHALAAQLAAQEMVQALDSLGHATVESGATVGLGLGVYRAGEPIVSAGYGKADLENRAPATDSTVFRIGSVTKQFTAAAILRLEEEGALSLDDRLTDFLPDYPVGDRVVTVRQLLNHTSGIASYTGLERWQEVQPLDLDHDEMLELFQDEPFDFEPGEGFAYNNSGYYLLGLVIEEASGLAYDEYLEEEFFQPLGLEDTRYCWESPVIPHRARGYQPDPDGDGVRHADPLSMGQPYAAGALCSSVRDLARWKEALRSGEVVSPESYERMTTPEALPEDTGMQYGFGLVRGELHGLERIEHGGGIHGFNALLAHYPEEEITVVALVNQSGPAANQAAEAAARIALGLEEEGVTEEVADLPLPAEERQRYVGTYDIDVLELRVFEEDDRLMAQGQGQPPFRLLHQGDHEFVADPEVPASIRLVFTVADGRAEALTLHQNGMRFEGPRID